MALNGLIAANNLSDVVDIERTWDNIGSNFSATVSVPSPTLDLNFAANKSLVDDVSGNNLITFSRASTGTFVGSNGLIQTAASGVPRFDHNPTTGESLGLLVEEARTNRWIQSEFQSTPDFVTLVGVSVEPNVAIAPNGQQSAALLKLGAGTNGDYSTARYYFNGLAGFAPWSGAWGNSDPTAFFIYVKFAGIDVIRFCLGDRGNTTDFSTTSTAVEYIFSTKQVTLLPGNTGSNSTVRAYDVGNGWVKLELIRHAGTRTAAALTFTSSATGNGVDGVLIFGAQIEAGTFPTSYIPTVASTVTRAADVASITGTNFSSWYNNAQGSFYGEWRIPTLNKNNVATAAGFGGNGNNGFLRHPFGTGSVPKVKQAIGLTNFSVGNASNPANQISAVDGAIGGVGANIVSPTYPNDLLIGYQAGAANYLNGTIARLTYYPVRLSNITLQALTTYGPVSSFPYSFSIKGRDILALKEINKTSTRDFVFIKGLFSKAQPRITTASQYTTSGVAFQQNALLKASPSSVGNYSIRSILAANLLKINENNVASLSLSPFSATIATAPISIASLGLGSTLQWTPTMPSGTITSPTVAIPIDFASFVLYAKAGQS